MSFGNIATGYTYAFPKAQITYRSPDMNGFKLAAGIMDPNKLSATSDEDMPRFEAELTYDTTIDNGSVKAWVNGMSQSSEDAGEEQDQSGVGYGVNVKFSGVSLTASGFSAEGVGHVAGLDQAVGVETIDTDGYLVQASYTTGANRFVVSYGESTVDDGAVETESSNTNFSYYRSVIPGVTVVAELNKTEIDNNSDSVAEENNVFSIGAVVTF